MQVSFLDVLLGSRKTTRAQNFLEEIEKTIPWYRVNNLLRGWNASPLGCIGYAGETMFRMTLLKDFYGLSDEEVEDQINDRYSFHRFMKLSSDKASPDATTLCKFRKWLTENNKQEKLFEVINKYLKQKGFFVSKGSMIDATIVSSPMNKSNDKKEWFDKEASSTKKGSQWYRGYKAHAEIETGDRLISTVVTTTAKVPDTNCFDLLLSPDAKAVFADKAYINKERKRDLRSKGIFCGILDKGAKNNPLSSSQKKRNKKLSSVRAFVEHPFNIIKNIFKFKKTRYVGIVKNTAHIFLLSAMHNIYRARHKLLALNQKASFT